MSGQHRSTPETTRTATPPARRGGAYVIQVVAIDGRSTDVEFRASGDLVEIWHRGHLAAVFLADILAIWLNNPAGALQSDDVTFSIDRMVDREGRVAISLANVTPWTLAHPVLTGLRHSLGVS